jgi:hypothetical protein
VRGRQGIAEEEEEDDEEEGGRSRRAPVTGAAIAHPIGVGLERESATGRESGGDEKMNQEGEAEARVYICLPGFDREAKEKQ